MYYLNTDSVHIKFVEHDINGSSTSILFADDTSLIVTDKNLDILDTKRSENLQLAYNWFKSNLLTY
jgi:hypothetical protein